MRPAVNPNKNFEESAKAFERAYAIHRQYLKEIVDLLIKKEIDLDQAAKMLREYIKRLDRTFRFLINKPNH